MKTRRAFSRDGEISAVNIVTSADRLISQVNFISFIEPSTMSRSCLRCLFNASFTFFVFTQRARARAHIIDSFRGLTIAPNDKLTTIT